MAERFNSNNPIAIIGLAGIFPDAKNIAEYWTNILHGVDCIKPLPKHYWNEAEYYSENTQDIDKTYSRVGGFIPPTPFDPIAYGIVPKALEAIDNTQLLSLLVAEQALRDAGYPADDFDHSSTGVVLGVAGTTMKMNREVGQRLQGRLWRQAMRQQGIDEESIENIEISIKAALPNWDEDTFPGMLANVVSGRISNRFNLGALNYSVDAACASSLAAVNGAVSALQMGQADLMITGGVDTDNSLSTYMCFTRTPALSPSGKIKPFDEGADGTLISEGIGMLVLKRLEDAQRDGDRIYATLNGIGASSDGRGQGISAPDKAGQIKALHTAYSNASEALNECDLIEAHGTGTLVGDQVEASAIDHVFKDAGRQPQSIALGSVKSQIGHCKAAAGSASLIKTVLALYHKVLPASINVNTPLPVLGGGSALYVNSSLKPWLKNNGANRFAGVSTLGFGGINYHAVLKEYSGDKNQKMSLNISAQIFNADSKDALVEHLSKNAPTPVVEVLNNKSSWINEGAWKAVLISDGIRPLSELREQAIRAITRDLPEPPGIVLSGPCRKMEEVIPKSRPSRIIAAFSGQGAQYPQMGRHLAVCEPVFFKILADMDQRFVADGLDPLSKYLYADPLLHKDAETQKQLNHTHYAQASVGVFSMASYLLLEENGFSPDCAIGHSFGELTALWVAKVMDDKTYLDLVYARGKALSPPAAIPPSTLLAVMMNESEVHEHLERFTGLSIANINTPDQVIIGGEIKEIGKASTYFSELGIQCKPVQVSAAFHTEHVQYARTSWLTALAKASFSSPKIPVYSNTTAQPYPSEPEEIKSLLGKHPFSVVRFSEQLAGLHQQDALFVEIGPNRILSNLIQKNCPSANTVTLNPDKKGNSLQQWYQALLKIHFYKAIEEFPSCVEVLCQNTNTLLARDSIPEGYSRATVWLDGQNYVSQKRQQHINTLENVSIVKPQAHKTSLSPTPTTSTSAVTTREINTMGKDISNADLNLQQQMMKTHQLFLQGYNQQMQQVCVLMQKCQEDQNAVQLNKAYGQNLDALLELQQRAMDTHQAYLNIQQIAMGNASEGMNTSTVAPGLSQNIQVDLEPPQTNNEKYEPITTRQENNLPISQGKEASEIRAVSPERNNIDALASQSDMLDLGDIKNELKQIVSDKTGYPLDVIDDTMDVEADLGVDSIKRIEILSEIKNRFTLTSEDDELLGLRSVDELVAVISEAGNSSPTNESNERTESTDIQEQAYSAAPEAKATPADKVLSVSAEQIIAIISEKTGYPEDVFELDMDLESDLGVDSIKRIEILSAFKEAFTELTVDEESISSLRTIGEFLEAANRGSKINETFTKQNIVEPLNAPTSENLDIPVSHIRLQKINAPATLPYTLHQNHRTLLVHSGGTCVEKLIEKAKKQHIKVCLLILPDASIDTQWTTECEYFCLDSLTESTLVSALEHLNITHESAETCPLSAVICSPDNENTSTPFAISDNNLDRLKWMMMLAKHVKQHLNSAAAHGRASFIVSAQLDGELGFSDSDFPVTEGAYAGLIKTLSHEWPAVLCRFIDLGRDINPKQQSDILWQEWQDCSPELKEVSWKNNIRYTKVMASTSSKEKEAFFTYRHDKQNILVTGGARGISMQCVMAAAKVFPAKYILLGRTALLSSEPVWATGKLSLSELMQSYKQSKVHHGVSVTPLEIKAAAEKIIRSREVLDSLNTLKNMDVDVDYYEVDISNEQSVASMFSTLREQGIAITGLIHGAGAIRDKLIEDKSEQDFNEVFGPKVVGLNNVMNQLDLDTLDVFVLFSSAAAAFGNTGQADYAMANEVLNQMALKFKQHHPNCQTYSFNWGPWDGGMVTEQLRTQFAEKGVGTIPLDTGSRWFADQLIKQIDASPIVVVSDPIQTKSAYAAHGSAVMRYELNAKNCQFTLGHQIANKSVLPAAWALSWMTDAVSKLAAQWNPTEKIYSVTKFKVLKGINTSMEDCSYQLHIFPQASDEATRVLKVMISSGDEDSLVYHFHAEIVIAPAGEAFVADDLIIPMVKTKVLENSESLISAYRQGLYSFKDLFTHVNAVTECSPTCVQTRCQLPEMTDSALGFVSADWINPYVYDLATHGILIWLDKYHEALCFPASTANIVVYSQVPAHTPYYVTLNNIEKNTNAVSFDLYIHDEFGKPYVKAIGFSMVTMAKSSEQYKILHRDAIKLTSVSGMAVE